MLALAERSVSVGVQATVWTALRTSEVSPMLCRLLLTSLARSSRCRLSSASFVLFAAISSFRLCSDDMVLLGVVKSACTKWFEGNRETRCRFAFT